MKTKLLLGNIAGLPVKAGYHELGDGEISSLILSVASAAKGLLKVGAGVGLGLCLLSLLSKGRDRGVEPSARLIRRKRVIDSYNSSVEPRPQSPEKEFRGRLLGLFTIDEMAVVATESQLFTGICLDDCLSFFCGGRNKSVPIGMVKMIERIKVYEDNYFLHKNLVVMFDGSTYVIDDLGNDSAPVINFRSASGEDVVVLGSGLKFVRGTSREYGVDFISDLKRFISENEKNLKKLSSCDSVRKLLSSCETFL